MATKRPPVAPHRTKRRQTTKASPRPKGERERLAVRRGKALELRIQGKSYRAIAAVHGVSVETAYADVQAELHNLGALSQKQGEALRAIELERLDYYAARLTPSIKKGIPRAVDSALRIMERRAKLLGLDAASRTEVSGPASGPVQVQAVVWQVVDPNG